MPKKIQQLKSVKYEVKADLKRAFDTITSKRAVYDTLYAYYRGDHPLRYSTERLAKAFQKIGVYFAENWIAVIVDAVLDRLSLKGFDLSTEEASVDKQGNVIEAENSNDTRLNELWEELDLSLVADDVHEAATVTGEGYVIAWKEDLIESKENGTAEISEALDVFYNDPRMCHVFYDSYRPTQKSYAAKMWKDADGYQKMILYYPDRLEHYKSSSPSKSDLQVFTANSFQPDIEYGEDGVEPNEYGVIPVFHFRSGRTSGKREVDRSSVSIQDAINKLFADMMASSEFTTWAQRVIISQNDPGDMLNGAGINWWIPAGDGKGQAASVQELGHKDLSNFMDAMERLSQRLLIISRTPKHYAYMVGSVPSGDALLAMEAPLVKKVTKRIQGYDPEWKALASFIMKLEGVDIARKDITTIWEPVTSVQPLASAETIKTEVESGIPLVTAARRQGWAKDEMEQLNQDLAEDRKRKTSLAQDELDRMRAEDAKNNDSIDNNNGDDNAK